MKRNMSLVLVLVLVLGVVGCTTSEETTDTVENEKEVIEENDSKSKAIYVRDLSIGDIVDGFEVTNVKIGDNNSLQLGFDKDFTVTGEVIAVPNVGTFFTPDLPNIEYSTLLFEEEEKSEIHITPPYTGTNSLDLYTINALIEQDGGVKNRGLDHNKVYRVKIDASSYRYETSDSIEPFSYYTIEKIELLESYMQEGSESTEEAVSSESESEEAYSDMSNVTTFKSDVFGKFDLNGDGFLEKIWFHSEKKELEVTVYSKDNTEGEVFTYTFDSPNLEDDYYTILKVTDRPNFFVIGIIDYGPSADYSTELYGILNLNNSGKWFGSLGEVPGKVVADYKFDTSSLEDFNTKALVSDDGTILAPKRLSGIIPHTWYGRSYYRFNNTDLVFKDTAPEDGYMYFTHVPLYLKDVLTVYTQPDLKSNSIVLQLDQDVTFTSTDNKEWIQLISDQYKTPLYYHVTDDDNNRKFEGFSAYD